MPDFETSKGTLSIDSRRYAFSYPYSPTMRTLLKDVVEGREYPIFEHGRYVATTIVDVGANVGAAALWFHSAYPQAKIFCFEPSAVNFHYLRQNTAPIDQIQCFNYGLWSDDCDVPLYGGVHHTAQSSIFRTSETPVPTEHIALKRADRCLAELGVDSISILKLDTEGCETEILSALAPLLPRIDVMYLEYHSERDRRQIDHLIASYHDLRHAAVLRVNLGSLVYVSRDMVQQYPRLVREPIGEPRNSISS